ncbi:MAG: AAA family ATPase [Labilithrix sp.]|nr:AAA family ATPase [Labilithrix sp.]
MSTAEEFYANANAANDQTEAAPWETRVTVVPNEWYEQPAPPRRWLLRDSRRDGEGVLPLGKVGLLLAEGGAGKTMAVVQLSLAVATGKQWLGAFDVAESGKVLLILGEEDAEEVHRRIHRAARREQAILPPEGSIVTLPLTGIACSMIEDGEDSAFLRWLRKYVEETGPYSLVVADPVSRFCGPDAERDNAAGTRFCQGLESLVEPSGGATILGCHHVNKTSRGTGATVDASSSRGSSAITDGVRWVSAISVEHIPEAVIESVLTFTIAKTNYAKKAPPLELRYTDGGVLVPLEDGDRELAEQARDEADPRARRERKRETAKSNRLAEIDNVVVALVTAHPGIGTTDLRTNLKAKAGCSTDHADTAVARMILAGRVRRTEGKKKEHFIVEGVEQAPSVRPTSHANGSYGTGFMVDEYDEHFEGMCPP